MRSFIVLNGVLLLIALSLFAADLWLDGNSLLGSKMRPIDIQGRCMADFIVGQPVIPDQIHINSLQSGDFIAFWYATDRELWHTYPSFEVSFINGQVFSWELRER